MVVKVAGLGQTAVLEKIMTSKQPDAAADTMEFPCELDIKVFARKGSGIESKIEELLSEHLSPDQLLGVRVKDSSKGKYQSLSCRVSAESRVQIDSVYQFLGKHPDIIMLL